jgi:5-(aminomethyl)-3-furanmethanol phosphate kinase
VVNRPIVVKLGGSFAYSDRLGSWLDIMAGARCPLVLVAGGGPFADTVRAAQTRMGFNDPAAHRMALLAMAQFAGAIGGLNTRFSPAATMDAIAEVQQAGRIPVWEPIEMAGAAPDVPQSWEVTSDSLAAWLAGRLEAEAVVFTKQVVRPAGRVTAQALADAGVLDRMTPRFLAASGAEGWLAGAQDCAALGSALAAGRPAAARIVLS